MGLVSPADRKPKETARRSSIRKLANQLGRLSSKSGTKKLVSDFRPQLWQPSTGCSVRMRRHDRAQSALALEPSSVTLFENYAAKTKREEKLTLDELVMLIRISTAPTKDAAPWLKLARFGDQRSDKGSLRHDANLRAITGIEADYDRDAVGFYQAVDIDRKAPSCDRSFTPPRRIARKRRAGASYAQLWLKFEPPIVCG